LKSPQKVRQVDNVLIDAGSRIEAGSRIQAGGFRSLVLIEAGGFYLRFYGIRYFHLAIGLRLKCFFSQSSKLNELIFIRILVSECNDFEYCVITSMTS